jgi:hypothetical protein
VTRAAAPLRKWIRDGSTLARKGATPAALFFGADPRVPGGLLRKEGSDIPR